TGVLAEKCTAINHAWNHRMKTGMPWVIAKCGMSLDGRISSSDRRWITSETSRHHAMLFRRRVDAILVGGNTVRCDNPRLTVRGVRKTRTMGASPKFATASANCLVLTPLLGAGPYRVIWTRSKENIPKESYLLTDEFRERTIVLENCTLRKGLQNLAARGISSVLIEGGGVTLGKAFEENLVDEVRFYIAPLILGGEALTIPGNVMIPPITFSKLHHRQLKPDHLMTGLVAK
ncbi:MAG: RibD family protein, partial [Verrucomicrobia bacterium]|nr:RibD family protein [Verrucomicrobiota bacterium]